MLNVTDFINIVLSERGDKVNKDSNWTYYPIQYDKEKYNDIVTNGISSKNSNRTLYTGTHFINVIKENNNNEDCYSYKLYKNNTPLFIIDSYINKVKPAFVEDLNGFIEAYYLKMIDTTYMYRCSLYKDDYQVKNKIEAKHIIGLQIEVLKNLKNNLNNEQELIKQANKYMSIINWYNQVNKNIMLIDSTDNTLINQHSLVKKVVRGNHE